MFFCRSCFLAMVWFRYVLVFLIFLFLFLSSKYLSKLMLLDFRCQKISFLCKFNFCIHEKHTQWHGDTKVKVFRESISWFMKCPWNCISWNALKEKIHSVSFPIEYIFSKNTTKQKTKRKRSVKPWLKNRRYTSAFNNTFAEHDS